MRVSVSSLSQRIGAENLEEGRHPLCRYAPKMDNLRKNRGIIRGATTRLLSKASEILLRATLPSTADLQEILHGLHDKDSALDKLDKQITDALNGEEFGEEIVAALDFHDKIVKAISRLRSAMNACAPVGSIALEEDNHSRGMRVRATNPATP